jgi:SAM-dependent methyltransferase
MRAFSLEEILRACEEVVSGAANEVMDDGPERGWKRRSCPCCTSIEARFATQKGTFQYWRCKGCRSLFVGNPPHPAEQVEHYRRHYRALAPKFRDDLTKDTARVLAQTLSVYAEKLGFTERRLLDVGCGTGALQRWLAEDGWSGLGLEPGFGPEETLRPPGWEIRSQLIEQYLETSAERFPFVTFVNSLGTLANPAHVLRGTHELLTERGVVIALLPSSDFLPRKRQNTWRPLNTAFAGLHLVLPSAIGLARLARRSGFQCVTTPIPRISGYVAELIPWCPQV